MTQLRLGPPYSGAIPFYCPWCGESIDADPLDHAQEHMDKAPYATLITEEYWPVGLATHCLAEGIQ
jgi:hypothetical protein